MNYWMLMVCCVLGGGALIYAVWQYETLLHELWALREFKFRRECADECEHCQRCGVAYQTVYFAPDDLWSVGCGRHRLLCVTCFDECVRMAGRHLVWKCEEVARESEVNHA